LQGILGQPVVVDYKPGAGGSVGAQDVMRSPADGYTLMLANTGVMVINPALYSKLPYSTLKDFTPIARTAMQPLALLVNNKVPAKNLQELIAYAKANPGKINFGSGGEWLRKATGYQFNHVPYKGAAPATNDAVAGQIPMAVQDSMSVSAFITSGRLRPIANMAAERSQLFPELPTLREAGPAFKDFDVYTWLGLYAPAGTPASVLTQLNGQINKIMHAPEMVERLRLQYSEPLAVMDLAQTRGFVAGEVAKWQRVVSETGVKSEE